MSEGVYGPWLRYYKDPPPFSFQPPGWFPFFTSLFYPFEHRHLVFPVVARTPICKHITLVVSQTLLFFYSSPFLILHPEVADPLLSSLLPPLSLSLPPPLSFTFLDLPSFHSTLFLPLSLREPSAKCLILDPPSLTHHPVPLSVPRSLS